MEIHKLCVTIYFPVRNLGSNMLFGERDSVKLADFGLSKESLCSTYESKRTLHTEACGTAHYMAPEVMAGEEYGRKSDIW